MFFLFIIHIIAVMTKTKPIEYQIGYDGAAITLYIKDSTDYSRGTGSFSMAAYAAGQRSFQLRNNSFNYFFSNKNTPILTPVQFGANVPDISQANNEENVSAIPVPTNNTIYSLGYSALPFLDITVNASTDFKSGDYFVTTGNNIYKCMVDRPNPTISSNIILDNTFALGPPNNSQYQSIDIVVGSIPVSSFKVSASIELDCGSDTFHITDTTTYESNGQQPSLEVDEFVNYTKLSVVGPNESSVVIPTGYPASNGVVDIQFSTATQGDGLYVFTYINVPQYDNTQTYHLGEVVSYNGLLYIDNAGDTSDIANFTLITESELPSQYVYTKAVVVLCNLLDSALCTFGHAFCGECGNCDKCCENKNFIKTAKIAVLLDNINNSYDDNEKLLLSYKHKVNETIEALDTICQY